MKDQAERLVVFPFTFGCVTQTSTAEVGSDEIHRAETRSHQSVARRQEGEMGVKMKNPFNFLAPKISNAIRRLLKALKNFSQLFVHREESEEEKEMEIGFPTDVKHLTHIGWNGSTSTTNPVQGWENLRGPELVASPSISLQQFELAMAAQAADQQQQQHLPQISASPPAHPTTDLGLDQSTSVYYNSATSL